MESDAGPRLIGVNAPGEAISPGQELSVYPLAEGITLIGRSRQNDICLRDTSVSRSHCYLERHGTEVRIHDSMSRNRTHVGGEPARGQLLKDGDTICLGRCRFIFRGSGTPAKAAVPLAAARPPARSPASAPASGVGEPAASRSPATAGGARVVSRPRRGQRPPQHAAVSPGLLVPLLLLAAAGVVGGMLLSQRLLEKGHEPPGSSLSPPDVTGAVGTAAVVPPRDASEARSPEARYIVLQKQLIDTQAQMEALERNLDDIKRSQGSDGSQNLDALLLDMKKLKGDLDRSQKERDRLAVQLHEKNAVVGREEAKEERFLNPRPRAGEVSSLRGATAVAKNPQASGKPRSQKEVQALVARLIELVDDYASPSSAPGLLEPHLTALSTTTGKAAVEGLLEVCDHARRLLDHVDRNVLLNKQLREALLAQAERVRAKLPPEEGSGYKQKKTGAAVEDKQRELELREKAMQINADQRKRLVALREAILASVKNFSDVEATRCCASRLEEESDPELRLKILEVLEAARARHAVPILIRKLPTRDAALKGAIRRALAAIAGIDLGEETGAWQKWWEENRGA
jgi:pSer/pThr/pTyr-binding forkhead associated (FHA) protein